MHRSICQLINTRFRFIDLVFLFQPRNLIYPQSRVADPSSQLVIIDFQLWFRVYHSTMIVGLTG